jgi:membrane protease YdiL (CAAX protease family)
VFAWVDPHFDVPAAVVAVAVLGWVTVVAPFRNRRRYARLAAVRAADGNALPRYYWWFLARWSWYAALTLLLVAAPGVRLADLGLALPTGTYLGAAVALTAYALVIVGITAVVIRRVMANGIRIPARAQAAAVVPYSRRERLLAAAVSVTGGVGQELVFRGLLVAVGVGVLRLSPVVAALAAVLVFGAGRWYQGWLATLSAAGTGGLLILLYGLTGSLLPPMILHTAAGLASLLAIPAQPAGPPVRPADQPVSWAVIPRAAVDEAGPPTG